MSISTRGLLGTQIREESYRPGDTELNPAVRRGRLAPRALGRRKILVPSLMSVSYPVGIEGTFK